MKSLGSTTSKITKDENGENVPHLEINEVVLIFSNIVNNNYQQDSRVLYTFVPNKAFDQLLDILPKKIIFSKHLIQNFYKLKLWFTNQNSNPLEIEDIVKITLVIE